MRVPRNERDEQQTNYICFIAKSQGIFLNFGKYLDFLGINTQIRPFCAFFAYFLSFLIAFQYSANARSDLFSPGT